MSEKSLLNRIEINPEIMLGKPVIKGTRLTVEIIVEKLAFGATFDDIICAYSFIKKEDIRAALIFAAKTVSKEEVYLI
jgi:uncharacterized protein (DUF433 family)